MKIKWIFLCLLIAAGITGCKDKEESTTEPATYSNGLWGANIAGSGGSNPDILLYVEGENRQYFKVDWNKVRLIPLDDESAGQYENLAFDYYGLINDGSFTNESDGIREMITWLGWLSSYITSTKTISGLIVGGGLNTAGLGADLWAFVSSIMTYKGASVDYNLYKKSEELKKLASSSFTALKDLNNYLNKTYEDNMDDLHKLELAAVSLDSLNAVLIKQNQLAYFKKCNDDVANDAQIVCSRANAYADAHKMDSAQYFNMKTRDDSIAFYAALEPVLSEWAGEGGYYVEQTKKLMDKMVGTYSVATHGQSTYHVGMPSIYHELAELSFPDDTLMQDSLQAALCLRDLVKTAPAYEMTLAYCKNQIVLYHSAQAEAYLKEMIALYIKYVDCYPKLELPKK